mgnify:CR=1 FL=1
MDNFNFLLSIIFLIIYSLLFCDYLKMYCIINELKALSFALILISIRCSVVIIWSCIVYLINGRLYNLLLFHHQSNIKKYIAFSVVMIWNCIVELINESLFVLLLCKNEFKNTVTSVWYSRKSTNKALLC